MRAIPWVLIPALVLVVVPAARAQDRDFSKVEVTSTKIAPGIDVLFGAGGNIGVSSGPDGVVLIDDQYAPLAPKIRAAISQISDRPIRFVINTHWHGDHTGGNEILAGAGSLIVAHENVRKRMSVDQFIEAFGTKEPASPTAALPVVTFTDEVTFHLNGDEIRCRHVAPAHTDGDTVVWFRKANVVHMGDVFFNGLYPFIDVSSGGSIEGVIAAVDLVLAQADGATRIIPGHGPIGGKAELQAFRAMLAGVRDKVKPMVAAGATLAQVQAAKPTAPWDEVWGKGFLKPETFTGIVYASLGGKGK